MQYKQLHTLVFISASCLLFAGCKPKPAGEAMITPSPAAVQQSPVPVVEAAQVQKDICGKLSPAVVSQLTGVKVGPPTVITIDNPTSATRHVCSYNQSDETAAEILQMTVSFKKENKNEAFLQLWEAQKSGANLIDGMGAEVYTRELDGKAMMYVMTPDTQYWLRLGKTDQTPAKQMELLTRVAQNIIGR